MVSIILFLSVSVDSPIYIRPHSKTVLTLAITNDTHVLSSHLVMDYSLLVGIDDATKELVVGIIGMIIIIIIIIAIEKLTFSLVTWSWTTPC